MDQNETKRAQVLSDACEALPVPTGRQCADQLRQQFAATRTSVFQRWSVTAREGVGCIPIALLQQIPSRVVFGCGSGCDSHPAPSAFWNIPNNPMKVPRTPPCLANATRSAVSSGTIANPSDLHRYAWTDFFCMMRACRQTGKWPRSMHSQPQGKPELCLQRAD